MAKAKESADTGMIEFPIGPVDASQYAGRHENVQMTTDRQAHSLKMLTVELIKRRATIRGATEEIPVNSPARAVMWLLERVADETESVGVKLPK